jgi:MFS family permease
MGRGDAPSAVAEWRLHWTLPLAGAMGYSAAALQSYGFGPFVVPLEQEFGWSRAEAMAGLTVPGIFGLLFHFMVGLVIDRFGPRRVGLFGLVLMCSGFALLSTATGSLLNWMLLWVVVSLGVVCVQANVWTNAVASRFDTGRGFAIAVTLAGSSATATIAPLLAAYLMGDHGWRFAMGGVGLIWLTVTLPFVVFLFKGPKDRRGAAKAAAAEPAAPLPGATVKQGLRMRAFWLIAIGNFSFVFYTMAMAPNLVPLLEEKGTTFSAAAQLASLVGIVSIVARLSVGYLLDKFPPNAIATVIFLLPVIGCGLMVTDEPGYILMALSVAAFGATVGAEYDVVFYLTSRHMGLKSFGALLGAMLTAGSGAGILAPVISGYIHDVTGSYDLLMILLMTMMAARAVGMALLGKPKREWVAD